MTLILEPQPSLQTTEALARPSRGRRWWREVALVLPLYWSYTYVRGRFGSASVGADLAYDNALAVMRIEQSIGIANELAVQQWFLQWPSLVWLLNVHYGVLHFVAPIAVLATLFRKAGNAFEHGRNVLIATTALGLVGFMAFPLMPPRLLCACPFGSGTNSGFVDTLDQYGGIWRFGSHAVTAVSNQYAAMPSLHFAWALWCCCALWPHLRRRSSRTIVAIHPIVTLLVIVVTGNHFWLDAVGGAAVLAAGWGAVIVCTKLRTFDVFRRSKPDFAKSSGSFGETARSRETRREDTVQEMVAIGTTQYRGSR